MACKTCGGLVGEGGICLNPSCGGNDGVLNHAKKNQSNNKKNQNSSCWVATAYYGNSNHKEVELLREFRTILASVPVVGIATRLVNRFYHLVGRSAVGTFWATRLNGSTRNRIVVMISGCLLFCARQLAKLVVQK